MKKRRLLAAMTAAMCGICAASAPNMAFATSERAKQNDSLETLLTVLKELNKNLYRSGFTDKSAYALLCWGQDSIQCYVKDSSVRDEIAGFIKDNDIDSKLVDIIVSPDYDFRVPTGGNRSYDEVNTIVADEYFSLKKYLSENGVLSNVYLTQKCSEERPDAPYSCVEIYVKTQDDADALKAYMDENYYWSAVVDANVKPDLSGDTNSTIYNKDYICLSGDSNDDGEFGVADAIKLQRFVLAADTPTEREGAASDLTNDGNVDVFDLVLSRQKLVNN
ncbi:MAG: dockerin type I repeat-containing protein [Ruminococcus sp.]|nr:dockerin type I repeat-containing protein [Ruminococcus sp.]